MARHRWSRGLLVLVLVLVLVAVKADVFTSTAHLSNVLATETEVVALLDSYVEQTELRLQRIRRYIEELQYIAPPGETDWVERVVGNPLHAYQLMKRLTVDWNLLEKTLQINSWEGVLQQIYSRRHGLFMPTDEDLQGAALALVRLQETYRLNASDLAKGDILGIQSSVGLSARDCLYLGKHSYHNGFLDLAVEWYDEALRVADIEGNATAGPDEIKPYLDQAIDAHDDAIAHGGSYHTFEEPVRGKAPAELKKSTYSHTTYNLGPSVTHVDDNKNFQALCRGEHLLSPDVEKNLFCYLSTQDDPYFILHPVKIEQHNIDPPIFTFHDVITDNEIEHIKRMSSPGLTRATVVGKDGTGREVSTVRTSQTTWLEDDAMDEEGRFSMLGVTLRIERITKLKVLGVLNSETIQIANYGIGGHYTPHHDFLFKDKTPEQLARINENEWQSGDRIATFMFYLSDVTRGGATAFPRLGTAVWPKKGAAAFWYNLRKSCMPDVLTLHGACPVLHGSKWVANKWIRELSQPFNRPCGLSPEE